VLRIDDGDAVALSKLHGIVQALNACGERRRVPIRV